MSSPRRAGENGSGDGADAVGDAFQLVAQGLAQLQEALRLQQQEAERRVQEAVSLQEEAELRTQEAVRLQELRAATALREMEQKLQEKDDAIRALQQRLEETQERVTAVEERTAATEGSGGDGGLQRLESRVNDVEASLQSAIQTFVPRVEALLHQLEESQSEGASLATAASTSAASAREAPATGGAAAGGGEEPPSSTPTPTSSGAGHQGAAADEAERARQQRADLPLELRVRKVELRREEARNSPCPLGEQLCEAAEAGSLGDVQCLIECGANVNYVGRDGFTPLFNAAWNAHANVVSLLLQRGADANAISCGGGTSVLHFAAVKDPSGRCAELLLRAGADVDARDIDGEAPLHRAAGTNNEGAVRALLAAGARRDLKACKGRWKNKTPINVATSPAVKDLLQG